MPMLDEREQLRRRLLLMDAERQRRQIRLLGVTVGLGLLIAIGIFLRVMGVA